MLLWLFFAFIILFLAQAWYFQKWQRDLFSWHCKNIYPFHEKLTSTETEYIDWCIQLSWCELLRPFIAFWDPFISRLSFFTYSHRVKGNNVNSSRIAYGSAVRPDIAYVLAKKVIKERGIMIPMDPERDPNICFGGLGWDCEEETFRVYLRCYNMAKLPVEYDADKGEGGISWTYNKYGNLIETKTYKFPEKNVTYLHSSMRGIIPQYDKPRHGDVELSKQAKDIVEMYKKNGYRLDTIANHKDIVTLYFPKV